MKCSGRGAAGADSKGQLTRLVGKPASYFMPSSQGGSTSACARATVLTVFSHTDDRYMSCHMLIKIPSSFEAWTLTWLMVISMFIGMVTVTYFYIRRKMKRKYLLAKIERRRSRRSSEESARNSQQADAFKVT